MASLVQYYASVGIKVDEKALKEVDAFLKRIDTRLSKAGGSKGLRINAYVDESKLSKHLQSVFSKLGKGLPLKLGNVTVDPASLSKSIREQLAKATFRAPITAVLNRASLATVRQQLQAALVGINISPRVSSASVSGGARSPGTAAPRGSVAASRRASLTGRGDPSLQEFLGGTYSRSSLTAGNRRFVDAIMQRGLGGVGGQGTLTNMAVEGGLGAIGRVGAGSMMGRGVASLGLRMAGPVGGALGLVGSGLISGATSLIGGIWSTLGKVITTPFSMLGSAVSTVTSAFYRIALAAIPLVAGFQVINSNVQQTKSRRIALNTTAGRFGSDAATESGWLMNMANREGMDYGGMIDQFTSFIAATAPSMGLEKSRSVFEAFSQYGATHGATGESSKRAFYALSQMGAKGTIMSEELNQQLAEATGYSGMKSLVAEAYQMSLGRKGSALLTGEKAITELTAEMKKGAIKTQALLPFMESLMRKAAEPGLWEARTSSIAEENRFKNLKKDGWQNFAEGGGEEGVAHFWRMMQGFGEWWKENGTQLGMYFNSAVLYLDAFQESIKELFHFASTGESTSITDLLKQKGFDVDGIRDSLVKLKDSIVRLLGLNEGGEGFSILSKRIIQFVSDLAKIIDAVATMIGGLDKLVFGGKSKPRDAEADILRKDPKNLFKNERDFALDRIDAGIANGRASGLKDIVVGGGKGTWHGLTTLLGLAFGSSESGTFQPPTQNNYLPISLPHVQGSFPSLGTINPASIGSGTRASEVVTHKVDVTFKVEGNPEAIGLLVDEKFKQDMPVFLTSTIQKAFTEVPIR